MFNPSSIKLTSFFVFVFQGNNMEDYPLEFWSLLMTEKLKYSCDVLLNNEDNRIQKVKCFAFLADQYYWDDLLTKFGRSIFK